MIKELVLTHHSPTCAEWVVLFLKGKRLVLVSEDHDDVEVGAGIVVADPLWQGHAKLDGLAAPRLDSVGVDPLGDLSIGNTLHEGGSTSWMPLWLDR